MQRLTNNSSKIQLQPEEYPARAGVSLYRRIALRNLLQKIEASPKPVKAQWSDYERARDFSRLLRRKGVA